jgi:uncharacterized protein YkwD
MAGARTGTAGRGFVVLAALLALTFGALLALAAQPAVASAGPCPQANARPHTVSLTKIRNAMTCLVNNKRAKHGRRSLKGNQRLELVAGRHTKAMLAESCLRHRCPGEATLSKRVQQSGYTKGRKFWRFAEDLGFESTPRQMLRRLLHSRANRRHLMAADFRDIGVGVGWGTPRANHNDRRFATYTLIFAWRRP